MKAIEHLVLALSWVLYFGIHSILASLTVKTWVARHWSGLMPWYALGLIIIWTRDMPPAMLLTAICATLYFVIGAVLEERKLVVYYGDVYREYQARVPALTPLPWRYLDRESAEDLVKRARHSAS